MNRCVIVSAGIINDYAFIKSLLKKDDFFIFCDGGLRHADFLGVKPDVMTGDFDSVSDEDYKRWSSQCRVISLPREKDDTDTLAAVRFAISEGFDDFLLTGAMGFRFDHAFANIGVLLYLNDLHKNALLADDYSLMEIAGKNPVYIEDNYSFFSVLTVDGDAGGVCIKNAKYPLENAVLKSSFQIGVSNEVLPGKTASVSAGQGRVLVVKVR
ncbi:MAG: thiamine diphosphokinase [Treponema sp.]|nr:thiamine diphosphokinase [Treponema sp.]